MKIKVCGMREAENIADVANFGPDMMGFIFYDRSPRYAGELSKKALESLPAGTRKVGVFVNEEPEVIMDTARRYDLDFIQLHGDEPREVCEALGKEYRIIKAISIAYPADLAQTAEYEGAVEMFVFDTKTPGYGGSGRKFDHAILRHYTGRTPYLLSGGLSPEDAALLQEVDDRRCVGFDINSRFETSPGVKDAGLVREFIEAVRKQGDVL